MKEFWKEHQWGLTALVITITVWLWVTYLVPTTYMDIFVYAAFGWTVLGQGVVPWLEGKLKQWFN